MVLQFVTSRALPASLADDDAAVMSVSDRVEREVRDLAILSDPMLRTDGAVEVTKTRVGDAVLFEAKLVIDPDEQPVDPADSEPAEPEPEPEVSE